MMKKSKKTIIYSCSSICDNGAGAFSPTTCRCRLAARNFAIREAPGAILLIFSSSSASDRR